MLRELTVSRSHEAGTRRGSRAITALRRSDAEARADHKAHRRNGTDRTVRAFPASTARLTREGMRVCAWQRDPYEAAQESNLPSDGLRRPAGFEDRIGHQAGATPAAI
jgi:hypothetical protein